MRYRIISLPLLLPLLLQAVSSRAETGVTPTEIVIGCSTDQSGPTQELGTAVVDGAKAFFDRTNRAGGVHGRKIVFVARDDKYLPKLALENTQALVEQDHVFVLFGNSGTANIKAIIPYLDQTRLPFIFPSTGSSDVRRGSRHSFFTLRAGYEKETESSIKYLIQKLGVKSVGIVAQDDASGDEGRLGVNHALTALGQHAAVQTTYSKAKGDLAPTVAELLKSKPEAIYMHAIAGKAIEFTRLIRQGDYKPLLVFSSLVGALPLLKALGPEADRILVSEALPHPNDTSFPVIVDYQKDLKARGVSNLHAFSLESYLAAKTLVKALEGAGTEPTRESLISSLESMKDYDLGGIHVSFAPDRHQGISEPFLFYLEKGKSKPVSD